MGNLDHRLEALELDLPPSPDLAKPDKLHRYVWKAMPLGDHHAAA